MRGVPVAFLLTTDLRAKPIELWLSALSKAVGTPGKCPLRYITTDDSKTERLAITNAFNGEVKVHLCLWHIARAWSQKIQTHVCGQTQVDSKLLQKDARQELLAIMYEGDILQARQLIQSEDRMGAWMKAYRQDEFYAGMDTNNYVESWHNHLKMHFLKRQFRVRADRMVYLLSNKVVDYFKNEEFQAYVRVGRKHLLVLARRFPEKLSLLTLDMFDRPSVADSLPSNDDSTSVLLETTDAPEERLEQEAINHNVSATLEALAKYTRAADSDVRMVELLAAALEHAMTLVPTPDAHPNAKRVRQEQPVKRKREE
ncbi:hypothetical protein BGX34_004555 [Mortierella sp. NVP85]|nr:hypothetical protein BGX34_004555 [Mortierella sp. NVP85]